MYRLILLDQNTAAWIIVVIQDSVRPELLQEFVPTEQAEKRSFRDSDISA